MLKYQAVGMTIDTSLKYPFMQFGEMLDWYPEGLPEDIMDVLQVVWCEEPERIKEAYDLAQKREQYAAKKYWEEQARIVPTSK
jgi:hypothetical protein